MPSLYAETLVEQVGDNGTGVREDGPEDLSGSGIGHAATPSLYPRSIYLIAVSIPQRNWSSKAAAQNGSVK